MTNIQSSRKLNTELDKRAKRVLEKILTEPSLKLLKHDMLLAEKGKVPESVVGMIYEKALNTYIKNPSKFPAVLEEFEEALENYFPFGGVKMFESADFSNIANNYFPGN